MARADRILLALAVSVVALRTDGEVKLVARGKAAAAIYIAPEIMAGKQAPSSDAGIQQQAAKDLARCLGVMSGAEIEIVSGTPAPTDKRIPILVGALAEDVFGGPGKTDPTGQGWRLAISRRGVGLIGETGIHVAGHGGFHTFFAADVFDHDHRAEFLLLNTDKREYSCVNREFLTIEFEIGIHSDIELL